MQGVQLDAISINFDQQSTLARLLARENIAVIHGAYKTAWFDPEKRVLALPIWKNKGKAVYDMLTGHEVGHALYTPAKGWHEAVDDIGGAPKAYLNILEDVRIERKIQDRYPGLRFQFQKAYKQLSDEDFFGLVSSQVDINTAKVIDKINIKSKLGQHIEVEFDNIEQEFFDKAFLTETFDDVIALAKAIYAYQKLLDDQKPKFPQITLPSLPLESMEDDSNDYEKPDPQEESEQEEKQQPQQEASEKPEEASEPKQDDGKTGIGGRDDTVKKELAKDDVKDTPDEKKSSDISDSALEEAMTDKIFRDKEKELVETGLKNTAIYTINKVRQPDVVIDYKEYYNYWKTKLSDATDWHKELIAESNTKLEPEFKKFKHDTETAAAYMAKEFELRKAAYQYSRSSIQKTGVINTNKLHAYKYSEDIFLKSTKLANYKNHGMMLFIDFSGSMSENMGATIRQMLNLAEFCRVINVPFEVYAFTTRVRESNDDTDQNFMSYSDCEVIAQKFNLLTLISSRMSRREYNEAFRMQWNLSQCWDNKFNNTYITEWNHLHSTPLNTCIVYAHELIEKYKLKHNVEKMTAMFLTDGDSDSFQIRMTDLGNDNRLTAESYYSWRGKKAIIRMEGKSFNVDSVSGSDMTKQLLRSLKQSTGSSVLGFFISEYRNQAVAKAVSEAPSGHMYSYREKYTTQLNKNRCLVEDNIFGYDRYFGLCTKYMDIVEDEFGEMVEDGASKGKIKTAFAKMTKAKRVNRILLNAFVDAIA
jgi:hypothetical protein